MPKFEYGTVVSRRRKYPVDFSSYPLTTDRDGRMADPLLKCESVLEVGAGERKFLPDFSGAYFTMDVDRSTKQDFYSIDEIKGSFDGIVMREVVEHIPRETFYSYLEKFYACLNPGGVLVLSTPNPMSVQFWTDYTHISPWPIHDMCSILESYGFENISIYRVIWPSKFLWLKRVYWNFHSRMYLADYAGAYVAISRKPTIS
jgi:SAM-dependent methyltransferase